MFTEELRQVIIVNAELGLPKASGHQVAHAAVAAFLEATSKGRSAWVSAGMPKVILKARGETALPGLEATLTSQENIVDIRKSGNPSHFGGPEFSWRVQRCAETRG